MVMHGGGDDDDDDGDDDDDDDDGDDDDVDDNDDHHRPYRNHNETKHYHKHPPKMLPKRSQIDPKMHPQMSTGPTVLYC